MPPELARGRIVAWWPVAAAALAIVAMHFLQALTDPLSLEFPFNGTPRAPHSDALGPWLHGGMAYFFGVDPPYYLYRPTIGMFWGAILAASNGLIEAIAWFWAAWLCIACAVAATSADRALRGAFVILLCYFALRFPETWHLVRFDIDLAALAITLSGMILVLWDRGPASRACVLAGCACLGIAAAIRGPMMLAGPLVIAIRLFVMERPSRWMIVAAAALFLAPIVADGVFQAHHDINSNGWLGLYCVYADPSHGYTSACAASYRKTWPPNWEVLKGVLGYRLSIEGMAFLAGQLASRVRQDLLWLCSPATFAIVLGVSALASRFPARAPAGATPFVRALLVVASLVAAAWWPHVSGPAIWIAVAILVSALLRSWRAFTCFAAYVAACLFLGLLGVVTFDRFVQTFAFLLPLGIGLFVMQGTGGPEVTAPGSPRVQRWSTRSVAALLVFLYAGSFAIKGPKVDTFLREVSGRPDRAIKISDEPGADRSLYYIGERKLIYTRRDNLPIGAVRSYRALANANIGNNSLIRPNAFLE